MFVQKFDEISPRLRGTLGSNPFARDLSGIKSAVQDYEHYYSNTLSNIHSYEQSIASEKVNRQIYKQQIQNQKTKLTHIQKAFDEASKNVDCEYLNVESMVQFFEGIGNKFVRLWMDERNSRISLQYVRPSGFISYLPVPPMLITIEYKYGNDKYAFVNATARTSIKCERYWHPHCSDPGICLGNLTDVIDENNFSIMLDGYQDHVLLLNNLLDTYNPDSPYRTPAEILSYAMKEIMIDVTRLKIVETDGYQFSHPKLNHNQSLYHLYDIIGLKEHEAYLEAFKKVKLFDVADDFRAKILMFEHSGDSNEELDYMKGVYNSLNAIFPNEGFSDPDDFSESEYSDDDDNAEYFLTESSFDDLKDAWLTTINNCIENVDKEAGITLRKVPDLNQFFVDRETSNDEGRQYVFN